MAKAEDVQEAVRMLLEAAAGATVVLFGSHARGTASPDSDIDLLVLESQPVDCLRESARLSRLLGQKGIPAEVIVVSREHFAYWRDTPNTLFYRAAKEGKVYEQVA